MFKTACIGAWYRLSCAALPVVDERTRWSRSSPSVLGGGMDWRPKAEDLWILLIVLVILVWGALHIVGWL